MKINIILLILFLSGCGHYSGVVSIGPGIYKITRQAGTGFVGSSGLKDANLLEAGEFCAGKGKSLKVIRAGGSHPPYIFGNFPRSEIQFKCVNTSD